MAGLLDFLSSPEMAMASGLLGGGNFGEQLQRGQSNVAAMREAAQKKQMQDMQIAEYQQKMANDQQAMAEQAKMRQLVQQFSKPAQPGMAPIRGDSMLPTDMQTGIQASAGRPAQPASFDRAGFAAAYEGIDPIKGLAYAQSIQKDDSPLTVKEGDTLLDRKTFKPVFSSPKTAAEPAEMQMYRLAQEQGYTGGIQDFVIAQKRAGATNVSTKIENKMGEGVAAQVGPMLRESYTAANGAAQTVDAANRIMQAADSGKLIAGPGADARLKMAQIGQVLGVGGKNAEDQIANTRAAIRGLSEMTLQGRKQMTGQGAITESESKLAEKANSGDLSDLTVSEIKQLANASARAAQFVYGQHNEMVKNLMSDPNTSGLAKFYKPSPMQQMQTTVPNKVIKFGELP